MMTLPSGIKIFLATQPVDMRRGFDTLAAHIQGVFKKDNVMDSPSLERP